MRGEIAAACALLMARRCSMRLTTAQYSVHMEFVTSHGRSVFLAIISCAGHQDSGSKQAVKNYLACEHDADRHGDSDDTVTSR
jgi:hypothetical protein